MKKNMDLYEAKKATPDGVARIVKPGMILFTDTALAQAPTLQDAIFNHIRENKVRGVEINTFLDVYPAKWYDKGEGSDQIRMVSWFNGRSARMASKKGIVDFRPTYYSEATRLVRETPQIDLAILAASPMDSQGFFNLGVCSSMSDELLRRADHIVLEVNKKMPRSLSSPVVHISQVDSFCEVNYELPVVPDAAPDEVSQSIGELIADEIKDGSTLQFGVGAIPNAVGFALKDKKHIGIHTEAFVSSMVELIECGAVDNSQKPIHQGVSVTTFVYGSKATYDYIHDNRAIKILPVEYVNKPSVIATHPSMISVNGAMECDLYGQVCAENVGGLQFSGVGGQVDFVRGATHSRGGKSYIAFPSTVKGGEKSRIHVGLQEGAIITTSRYDVDNIVTEYGIAPLRGKTESERAKALIAIAHPKFRDELTFHAKKKRLII